MYVICEIVFPIYISVLRLKACFTFNNSLSWAIEVLIKHNMSSVVDTSALGANIADGMLDTWICMRHTPSP